MAHLNRLEFTDVNYNLGAKKLLAKIYFEHQSFDALESLLHAFKAYLHRNRVISEDVRRSYLRFIEFLRRIMAARPEQYAALRGRIEKSAPLTEKNWLLRLLG